MAEEKRKVLVPIANGSEEIEAVCIVDTLRRAGADVAGVVAEQRERRRSLTFGRGSSEQWHRLKNLVR